MRHEELATRLVTANETGQQKLLRENSALSDVQLAHLLKDICLEGWSSDTARAQAAATALKLLSVSDSDPEIGALSAWAAGLAALIREQMDEAILRLDESRHAFLMLNKQHLAASTQVSKLIALAYLGRYEEAIECGLSAREVFLRENDLQAVGKIEHNIGNLYFRRDRYFDAEIFQTAARERFTALNDQKQLATVNNCLANTHALLHKFKSAEELYDEAVCQAETAGMPVTLAGIEGNIGTLALLQGRYDRALDYLERSRRRYASLGMTRQAVNAEHEIADAYVELSLAPEAIEIYRRLIPKFAELGLRAEHARSLAYLGRALIILGNIQEALSALSDARDLYGAERNEVGEATVMLSQAYLHNSQGDFARAAELAVSAQTSLGASGGWQRLLLARWLQAEAERAQGNAALAQRILQQTLHDAQSKEQPQVAQRCHTSLGSIAMENDDWKSAEQSFRRAVDLIEKLRAPLPGEEFRTAFFSDKLVPYISLAKLCLDVGRSADALRWVESARSRALAEALGGNLKLLSEGRDEFEVALLNQIQTLSEELNYLYNELNRPVKGSDVESSEDLARLHTAQRERESKMLEITRQLQHRGEQLSGKEISFSLETLQSDLGPDTALVEYTSIDEDLVAFVVTDQEVVVHRPLAPEAEVAQEIANVRFQIDSLRYGSKSIRKHLPTLTERICRHLATLYDRLIRPLDKEIGDRRLVIVPNRSLHYLPFHALYDGKDYLIERREVLYAPSAVVLRQCLQHPGRSFDSALVFAVADEVIPHVAEEAEKVAAVFPSSRLFLNDDARINVLQDLSPHADVIHLACHAQFRNDNPLFSALHLGDGWFTVRDAYRLKLDSSLVTLSACETGVSAVCPGEELIGLARGFLSAGSPSVMLSLWTVDDEATAQLMVKFYGHLRQTNAPAHAIRMAQMSLLKEHRHPYFWSPFVVMGRW